MSSSLIIGKFRVIKHFNEVVNVTLCFDLYVFSSFDLRGLRLRLVG